MTAASLRCSREAANEKLEKYPESSRSWKQRWVGRCWSNALRSVSSVLAKAMPNFLSQIGKIGVSY